MAFIRVKERAGRSYAYLVESIWNPGVAQPRQQVLMYLGLADEVQPEHIPPKHRRAPAVARWLAEHARSRATARQREMARWQGSLRVALLAGDIERASSVARKVAAKLGLPPFLHDVLAPTMRSLKDGATKPRTDDAGVRIAARCAADLLRRLRDDARIEGARRRGERLTLLLANPEGEPHDLALDLLECILLARGHQTLVIAGGAPAREIASRARELAPDVVLVSATCDGSAATAASLARALRAKAPGALVAIGGAAVEMRPRPKGLPRGVRIAEGGMSDFLERLLDEARLARASTRT